MLPLEKKNNCHLVDLTECSLPEALRKWEADFPHLADILSEYTGHMSLKPKSELIGVFNYSLFDKFSYRWSLTNGRTPLFLPKITPKTLLARTYPKGVLSCVESTPVENLWGFYAKAGLPDETVDFFRSRYTLPEGTRVPLKGSFVLDRDIFFDYQDWLVREIPVLLDALRDATRESEGGPVSTFAENRLGDKAHTQVQRYRHLIGGGCERLAGWYLAKRYAGRPLVRIGDALRQKPQPLEDAAAQAADANGNVILVICNSNYKPILENWICSAEAVADLPILICAMDEQLAEEMADAGFVTCHLPWTGNLHDLWKLRLDAVRRVVSAGYNAIHTDVDAVWVKNPIPILDEIDADVIGSQGTIWPPTALEAWGHVMCFGFVFFRSSPASLRVINQMTDIANASETFDDQKALNETLIGAGVNWQTPETPGYPLEIYEKTFVCHKAPLLGEGAFDQETPIRVALLPHSQFRRMPNDIEPREDLVVGHPYAPKTAGDTERVLRQENCWVLPEAAT